MDEPADGEYARAPELEDLLALCRSLEAERVRYLLIGGFAVILHGSVRGTKDIDLLIDPSVDNMLKLASKQLLIRMKDTVRPSDQSDVAFLRLLMEEEGRLSG